MRQNLFNVFITIVLNSKIKRNTNKYLKFILNNFTQKYKMESEEWTKPWNFNWFLPMFYWIFAFILNTEFIDLIP